MDKDAIFNRLNILPETHNFWKNERMFTKKVFYYNSNIGKDSSEFWKYYHSSDADLKKLIRSVTNAEETITIEIPISVDLYEDQKSAVMKFLNTIWYGAETIPLHISQSDIEKTAKALPEMHQYVNAGHKATLVIEFDKNAKMRLIEVKDLI